MLQGITGTFLDEITDDIPSNNWGPGEWERDFAVMKAVGIDTVIMIRSGLGKRVAFDSLHLQRAMDVYPAYYNLPKLFLELAEKYGMDFYFPTYHSNKYLKGGDFEKEIEVSLRLIDEIWERFGHHRPFKGWYLVFELSCDNEHVECVRQLGTHCKKVSGNLPCLISPKVRGPKWRRPNGTLYAEPVPMDVHKRQWEAILEKLVGSVDYVAFMDGHCDFEELPEYHNINAALVRKHGMTPWANIETFDRDMPIRFPPIEWRKLRWKIEAAREIVDKMITFEFSHFLSPFSWWPSARNLFMRYCKYHKLDGRFIIQDAESLYDSILSGGSDLPW